MHALRTAAAFVPLALCIACTGMTPHPDGGDSIVVRSTSASPDEVTARIKTYATEKKWAFLGANKVKNGEITMVKVCIPAVGAALWQANMQLTALLPCGNVSIYAAGGKTEVAMLHPSYMHKLHPSAETEKAAQLAEPELMAMLEGVTK